MICNLQGYLQSACVQKVSFISRYQGDIFQLFVENFMNFKYIKIVRDFNKDAWYFIHDFHLFPLKMDPLEFK